VALAQQLGGLPQPLRRAECLPDEPVESGIDRAWTG